MSVSARSATLRLLQGGHLRPRQLRDAFEGVAILALEFQHSGRQERWPYPHQPAAAYWSRRITSGQKRAQLVLRERCRKFVHSLQGVRKVSAAGGRCADKVARALEEAYCAGKVRAAQASSAERLGRPMQVKADRIAIPECGRTFDGARYLVPRLQAGFISPERLLKQRPASEPPPRIPRARFHVSPVDQRALFAKMDAAGMLEAEFEHNVPRGPGGESLACGMFAVPKDPEVDRLITNRIPANSTEQSMQASRDLFPHASCFCELQLSRSEELSISALDLPDFYHTFSVSRARALRNQLGPPRAVTEVEELAAFRRLVDREGAPPAGARVSLLQATLPMGDVNATDVAEAAHIGLLRAHGAALPAELVSYRAPVPRAAVWQSIMVDDNVIIAKRRRGRRGRTDAAAGARETELVASSFSAYRSEHLEPKPKKTILHAKEADALGASIDGVAGWVSAKAEHLVLAFATLGAAIEAGGSTHEAAALGAALLTHALLMRREAMCLVDGLYSWVLRLRGSARSFGRMPDAVADEIQVLAGLAPLLGTDLRARSHPELFCADARGGAHPWGGICRSAVPDSVARELWRIRTRKGGAQCLDDRALEELKRAREMFQDVGVPTGLVAEMLEVPGEVTEEVAATREWVGDLVKALDWRRKAFGFPLKDCEHINLGEYRALRTCVRRLIRENVYSSRVLVCTDSNVVLGAVAKGRSRSTRLRRLQQNFVAELLYFNIYLGALPVGTADNPADDPSRLEPVRRPVEDPAPWVLRFLAGDLSAIDAKLWDGGRERWLPPPGWSPQALEPMAREWSLAHSSWAASQSQTQHAEGINDTPTAS